MQIEQDSENTVIIESAGRVVRISLPANCSRTVEQQSVFSQLVPVPPPPPTGHL